MYIITPDNLPMSLIKELNLLNSFFFFCTGYVQHTVLIPEVTPKIPGDDLQKKKKSQQDGRWIRTWDKAVLQEMKK